MPLDDLYWARRPFQYGPDAVEDQLDRGQIFKLRGERLDEKLTRLGYCAKLEERVEPVECGECGKRFVDEGARHGHGQQRHRRGDRVETEEEAERRLSRIESEAPLFLERTAASAR